MTLTIYDQLEQGTPEWLEARRGIVTASTVGKLLTSTGKIANNDTSRTLIETLAIERITGLVEYIHPSRDMQRGTLLEPTARELYEQHHAPVDEVGFIRTELGVGTRLGYSPDGLVGDEGLLEIKSRTPRIQARTIRLGEVPAANMAQLQCGLLVTGREWIDYCSYSPGMHLFVKRVYPDLAWMGAIRDAVAQAEDDIGDLIHDYRAEVAHHNMPATEWWDPLDEGEEIF